jgi:Predicted periplasmic protein
MLKTHLLLLSILLTGCSYIYQADEQPQTINLEYQCDESALTVQKDPLREQATLILDGQPRLLHEGLSARGERFTDGVYVYWSEGPQATFYKRDRIILHNCTLKQGNENTVQS